VIVLTVSTGVRAMRIVAAAALENVVLIGTGMVLRLSCDSNKANTPAFANVSPKRALGPWIRPGRKPR
jgi:hypothetical protein